jgi:hypothetical protein
MNKLNLLEQGCLLCGQKEVNRIVSCFWPAKQDIVIIYTLCDACSIRSNRELVLQNALCKIKAAK